MLSRFKIPKTILWVTNLLVIFLLIFTLFRLATFLAFRPKGISLGDVIPSFLMGIRYDLRWIAFILLPIIILSMTPKLSPFYSARNKKWWTWYLAVSTFIVFFCFCDIHNVWILNTMKVKISQENLEIFHVFWNI